MAGHFPGVLFVWVLGLITYKGLGRFYSGPGEQNMYLKVQPCGLQNVCMEESEGWSHEWACGTFLW